MTRAAPTAGLALALAAWAGPVAAVDTGNRVQGGLLAGLGPTEPLATQVMVGAWFGLPLGERFQVEGSGTFQDGLEQRSELSRFLTAEDLLDTRDAIADRTLWTGELTLRLVPLRGKLALLQASLGSFALHTGVGGGVRATESLDETESAIMPAGLLTAGVDFLPGRTLILRFETRVVAQIRRDDTAGMLAELLLGIGGRL